MQIIARTARYEIIEVAEAHGADFYVYAGERLLRVCPSLAMAREVAASI